MMIFSKIYLCRWFMLYLLRHLSGVDCRTGRAYTQNFKSVRAGIWSAGGSVPDALP